MSGIKSYQVFGRFSADEQKILQELGEHEYMQKLKVVEISYVIYALTLLKLWVEQVPRNVRKNVYLGVSNKKLLKGRSHFAISMLKLKQTDEMKYKELRGIIDDSVLTAKKFFSYSMEHLVKVKPLQDSYMEIIEKWQKKECDDFKKREGK